MYVAEIVRKRSGAPVLSRKEIDIIGENLVSDFNPDAMQTPQEIDIDLFVQDYLGADQDFQYLSHCGVYLGMTVFNDTDKVPVYDPIQNRAEYISARANTIIIDRTLLEENQEHRYRFTMGHEASHVFLHAASLTGKLAQLANGAIYADTGEVIEFHDRKLDALEDIIEASNEKPLLVAYWFRHDLGRIKKRFHVREIKTSRDIADWNAGKIPVAVIHPASAGHGLNLQAGGSTLVWFGLTWSLELYQQTNARLWRQGQESGTVVIQHIITKGTIDERIVKALSKKEMTQTALIDAVKADLEVV